MIVWRHLVPSLLWLLIIAALYAIPGSDIPDAEDWFAGKIDKVAHLVIFSFATPMMITGLLKQVNLRTLRTNAIWISVSVLVSYGILMEYLQGMVFVDRTTDVWDIVFNTIGVFTGLVIFRLIYGKNCVAAMK